MNLNKVLLEVGLLCAPHMYGQLLTIFLGFSPFNKAQLGLDPHMSLQNYKEKYLHIYMYLQFLQDSKG